LKVVILKNIMISIAICTHDRSEDVALCLSALAPQMLGQPDELILVDSCSTPQHAEALKSLSAKYSARLLRLERPGHSLARNGAVASANGEWVAFLDDDAVPFPDWLTSLHKTVDTAASDLAAVGGPTEPLWPYDSAPDHIGSRWLFYLSCIQETAKLSVRQGAKVCGANLAFRKDSLLAVGGFHCELGRIGDRLTGGEDTLAVRLLLRRGLEVMYDPSVKVKHRIHRERLTLPWISKRAYWEGVTEIAMVKATGEPFPLHLAVPKLIASLIVFRSLFFATRNPDFLIRSRIAAGALAARLKAIDPPAPRVSDGQLA
jgi:glycosyltransferase involved in cell wall biosynthesis